jgi:prepilin-type N-terminal cleavage/methylation domain-containing protein
MTKNVVAVSKGVTPPRTIESAARLAFAQNRREICGWHGACFRRGVMSTVHGQSARARCRAPLAPRSNACDPGFTLIELMIVVVIMGVLSTLATYGVRKYLLEAKKAEAASMLTQIRVAEEAYRDETFNYLGATSFDQWHPTSTPGGQKYSWGAASTVRTQFFDPLGVSPDGVVEYAYAVVAGTAGSGLPTIPTTTSFAFPTPTGPFYIAMAKADLDDDGTYTYALTYSGTSAIHIDQNF